LEEAKGFGPVKPDRGGSEKKRDHGFKIVPNDLRILLLASPDVFQVF
jgi:hypothetical protein